MKCQQVVFRHRFASQQHKQSGNAPDMSNYGVFTSNQSQATSMYNPSASNYTYSRYSPAPSSPLHTNTNARYSPYSAETLMQPQPQDQSNLQPTPPSPTYHIQPENSSNSGQGGQFFNIAEAFMTTMS